MLHRFLISVGAFFLGMLVCVHLVRAESPISPSVRATLYQKETRAEFSHRQWIIRRDQPGTLIADFILQLGSRGSEPIGRVRATITFKASTMGFTTCTANLEQYFYVQKTATSVNQSLLPFRGDTYENRAAILDILKRAESRLAKLHPEYAAKEPPKSKNPPAGKITGSTTR